MLEKLERIKLSEEILHRLRDMIKRGQFGYGDKLPVAKKMAEIFGVSRTTVREALAALEAEGWVTTRRGAGTYVKRLRVSPVEPLITLFGGENTTILEVLELRRILECEVASLAASRATAEDVAAMKQAHANTRIAISQGEGTGDADFAFHYALAQATKNTTIAKVVAAMHDLYHEVVRTGSKHPSKPHDYNRVLSEHEAILKAIEKHQSTAARKYMANHLESIHRMVEEVLMEQRNQERKEETSN